MGSQTVVEYRGNGLDLDGYSEAEAAKQAEAAKLAGRSSALRAHRLLIRTRRT